MEERKNKIENKRNLIDDQELPEGHDKRFDDLLKKTFDKDVEKRSFTIRKSIFAYIAIAAALMMVIGVTIQYYSSTQSDKEVQIAIQVEVQENNFSEEFVDINQYFAQQMNREIENIMCKLPYTDEANRVQLKRDIDELLKDNQSFVAEIKQSQDEELAINYLVQHYRTNIATLEFINEKLGKYIKC